MMKKFKGILKCNSVFVYPSAEEIAVSNLGGGSTNLITEANDLSTELLQKDTLNARPIGDLLDRGFGAHALANIEYVFLQDSDNQVDKNQTNSGFDPSPLVTGMDIQDSSLTLSIPMPLEVAAVTPSAIDHDVPDNNEMEEDIDVEIEEDLQSIDDDDADENVDDEADDIEEADDAIEEGIPIGAEEETNDATIIETIAADLQDVVDQPLTSADGLGDSSNHSSGLKLEDEPTKPVTNQGSSTRRQTPRKRNKYVRRVHGPILLSDEEAFFLCLNDHMIVYQDFNIDNTTQSNLTLTLTEVSLDALWSIMCSKNSKFPAKYKAYSFFRDQRFVVRSGMHFGVDFAVYRLLPTQSHSELCAHVVDAISSGREDVSSRHLSTLTRVMPDVMKLLVLCYVLPAPQQNDKAPSCGATIDIKESSQPQTDAVDAEDGNTGPITPPNTDAERKLDLSQQPCSREDYIRDLFPDSFADTAEDSSSSSSGRESDGIDCSTYKCLDRLVVRPVTVLVRRSSATTKNYSSVVALHQRYRRISILKKPREFVPTIAVYPRPPSLPSAVQSPTLMSSPDNLDSSGAQRPFKRRRDPTEVRQKAASKSNLLWAALASDGEPELSPKSKKRLKKRKWILKKFGNSKGFVR